MVTTIQLDEKTKLALDKLKAHHRESYNELLQKLIEAYQKNIDEGDLAETLEIISDPEAMREIAAGIEAYNKGRGKTLAELKKELDL